MVHTGLQQRAMGAVAVQLHRRHRVHSKRDIRIWAECALDGVSECFGDLLGKLGVSGG